MFGSATKDGATIAKEIASEDKLENLAIKVCSEISKRTEEEAGDGTTTSIIVAEALYRAGEKALDSGLPFYKFKASLESAAEKAKKMIREMARKELSDDDIHNVLLVASNYDHEMSSLILSVLQQTHRNGSIIIEESRGI